MKILFIFLRLLPLWCLKLIFGFFAIILYYILKGRRKVGAQNIMLALNKNTTRAKSILLKTYLYFAKMISINIKYLGNKKFIEKHVKIEGLENFKKTISLHKGVIFTTAHYGNFEMLVCAFAMLEQSISIMARPLDNKPLNELMLNLRQSCRNKVVSTRLSAFDFSKMLSDGKILGILADQYGGKRGLKIDFLDRRTTASEGLAVLSYKHNIPILCAYLKEDGLNFTVVIEEPIYPPQLPYKEAIESIMKEIYKHFERWIRDDPTKYLWMHNRWKT